jgi:hypothetical protein
VTAPALPGDDDVRAAADELLTQHRAGGTYPSVSALAKGFGINPHHFLSALRRDHHRDA